MIQITKLKKIIICLSIVIMVSMQVGILWPETVMGETAGDVLVVRVQYFGDRGDKIKDKATFSRSELEAMGSATYCYSNVTNVGTVMVMKARGPKLTTVISNAGIDLGSIQNVTFRTTDGYTRNFSSSRIASDGYYYPNLNLYSKAVKEEPEEPEEPGVTEPTDSTDPTEETEETTVPTTPEKETEINEDTNGALEGLSGLFAEEVHAAEEYEWVLNYIKNSDGRTITPREGALKGAVRVPAILALEYGADKQPGERAENLSMSRKQTYRFCIGQSKLTEGKSTRAGYDGGDVTSADSCHSIYGIDVTLYGSPVKGISLSVDNKSMKVGSRKKVHATINGDELFAEYLDTKNLKWSSSNTKVAIVDNKGNVTIKAKGKVVITATAPDGTSASITLGGKEGAGAKATEKNSDSDNTKSVIVAREINLGEKIDPETNENQDARSEMAEDAQELGETEQYSNKVAAGSAVFAAVACAAGAAFRVRRYRIDR